MYVDIDADVDPTHRLLHGIVERLENEDGMLRVLGGEMHDYVEQVFDTANFGQWAPLSPTTVALKGSSRILVDSGSLLDDLTGQRGRVQGESVVIETDERSAGYLAKGARGMPQRDPLPEPPNRVVDEWADELLQHLVHGGFR